MSLKNTLPLAMLLLLQIFCMAQNGLGKVSGSVIDSLSATILESATVVLTDSLTKQVQSLNTDSTGRFEFTALAFGSYQLSINYIGYQKKIVPVTLSEKNSVVALDKLQLTGTGKQLGEVEVLSEKPVIRNLPGKIIFDVAKTISDGAETANESLQKIPGVSINQDGSVQVRGKSGIKILVDGKPSPLANTNPEVFLKSIPANNIESIEVNTAPSAKYDASGSGIVINIKLKKGKLEGLNGSVSAGVGTVFNKFNGSGNINYKKSKVNVFANFYGRNEKTWNRNTDDRTITTGNTSTRVYQKNEGKSESTSLNGKGGIEYTFDKHHTFTYSESTDYWNSKWTNLGTGYIKDGTGKLLNTLAPSSYGKRGNLSVTNSLNFRKTWDSTEREWTIDVAHTYLGSNNISENITSTFDTLGVEVSSAAFHKRTNNKGVNHNFLFQTDFSNPFKREDSKLEVGIKEEVNLYNSNTDVFNVKIPDVIKDTLQSSTFKYLESVSAAYANYSDKIKGFIFSAGLRWEHTYVHSANNAVNQNYSSLFPSAMVGYEFNEDHNISLSYGRTIERPGFWMLNNVVRYNSPYSVWLGNPSIKPAYVNSLTLEYAGTVKNQSLSFSSDFSRTGGTFQSLSTTDSNKVTFSQYKNAGTETSLNFGFSGSFKITKWFDLSLSPLYAHIWFNYLYENANVKMDRSVFNFWGSATFRFWKNASLQISGWGNTGWVEPQTSNKPVGGVGITLKKKFFKDHFVVSISCRDVFNTMRWRTHVYTPVLSGYNDWKSESRIGYLTLTYQFGKTTFAPDHTSKVKSSRLGGGGGNGGGGN